MSELTTGEQGSSAEEFTGIMTHKDKTLVMSRRHQKSHERERLRKDPRRIKWRKVQPEPLVQETMAESFLESKNGLCLRTQMPDQINTNNFGLENTSPTAVFLKARKKMVRRYLKNSKSRHQRRYMFSEFENQECTIQNLTGKLFKGTCQQGKQKTWTSEITEGTGIHAVNQLQTVNNNKSFLCL